MDLRKFRQENINKARINSNKTNKIKGLKKFVIGKNKKEKYYNELIDELLENGYYKKIYDTWINNIIEVDKYDYEDELEEYEDYYKGLNEKDVEILIFFNYQNPKDLKELKLGFKIIEKPIEDDEFLSN
jgi:hypothetical protein